MRLGWVVASAVVVLLGASLIAAAFARQASAEACHRTVVDPEGRVASARCEDSRYWYGLGLVGGLLMLGGAVGGLAAWRAGGKA